MRHIRPGVALLKPLEAWDEEGFDRVFDINVKGPYFLLQALLPILANPASIVLNTSVNAHIGMPNSSVYAASKAALQSFIRTLSGELITRGIRLNAVSPGPISTPLYGKLGFTETDLKNVAESIQNLVPAGRFGEPSEIAKAVVFLASDEAAYTVGSRLSMIVSPLNPLQQSSFFIRPVPGRNAPCFVFAISKQNREEICRFLKMRAFARKSYP